jgi:uncharacterized protein Yka (UPF0111/DUF47 family)
MGLEGNTGGFRRFIRRARNISLLPPKDARFYNLFNEIADALVEGSNELIELFDAPIERRPEIEVRIRTCFIKCNRISESIEDLLKIAQQPPFDRPDISLLTSRTMKIIKYIKHAANRYVIYNFPSSDKEMREMAPILKSACVEIRDAFNSLGHGRKVDPFCDAIDRMETHADTIYHQGLNRRFAEIRQNRIDSEKQIGNLIETKDAPVSHVELLDVDMANVQYIRHVAVFFILREVYVELERAIDACTEVTDGLKRMVNRNV